MGSQSLWPSGPALVAAEVLLWTPHPTVANVDKEISARASIHRLKTVPLIGASSNILRNRGALAFGWIEHRSLGLKWWGMPIAGTEQK